MVVATVLLLAIVYLCSPGDIPLGQFRGLNNPSAMDQAQIARNLATGRGYTTQVIRPLALGIIANRSHENDTIDVSKFPDFYQSPLNPWVLSLALRMVDTNKKMSPTDIVYIGDRIVAGVAMFFFLLSVVVWYFVFARLFDPKLAVLACGLVLATDLLWRFSLSGLPQMLVLFLFSGASLMTLLAMEAREYERLAVTICWIVGAGIMLGLMTLAHGLSVWIFLGWLSFVLFQFTPRTLIAPAALAAYLLVVTPWMARNFQVCGNPFGVAVRDALYAGKPDEGYLRSMTLTRDTQKIGMKTKFHTNMRGQLAGIFGLMGLNVAAGAFFFALLHPFRNPRTSTFKWGVLLMWLAAFVGMAFYGGPDPVSENQLVVVFIPLFVAYGMAFLLVLWNRLFPEVLLFRRIFISVIGICCALPMLLSLLGGSPSRVQWPPYIPSFVAVLGDWFTKDEIICSDMPWAVAWYAHRTSLLMPDSLRTLNRLHDYGETKQTIAGLYLTPLTGDQKLYSDIYNGVDKDWTALILRPPKLDGTPFSAFAPLPINGECIIFADHDRWSQSDSSSQ